MSSRIPAVIRKVGFDFYWSNRKVWNVKVPVTGMSIKKLEWMFAIPFWSKGKGSYNLTPREVIKTPQKYKTEYRRVMKANLRYPLDVMFNKGRWLMLDGLHRVVKAKILEKDNVRVRKIPRARIKDILKQPAKHH
ncbi:hypothetical protein HY642_05330 [Candidatus Woesearchaeota archaeon]|nr:hypothetical protein [Candidatus Woesearchaeota archaeon]